LTSRILEYLTRHALAATALVCSLLALAGSSYAAFTISGSQIRNHTINPSKLNPKYINGEVRAWAIVSPSGGLIRGAGGPHVTPQAADPGGYQVRWRVDVRRCATSATIDEYASPPTEQVPVAGNPTAQFVAGFAVAASSGRPSRTAVQTFNGQGQPTPLGFDVVVVC
jgi:hypothetical protein